MIYYPLAVLMLAGIRDILVITTARDLAAFRDLLGDGSDWGIAIEYATQPHPAGIAEAYRIGKDFVGTGASALILGDNIFYGHGLPEMLRAAQAREKGATIFAYHVANPESYGVVSFDAAGRPAAIAEKPSAPESRYAVTGLYFYDAQVVEFARGLKPSARGELEITDINRLYLEAGQLEVEVMGRGFAWLDTGTPQSLLEAALYAKIVEDRQGLKICCPEEIAWRMKYIGDGQYVALAERARNSAYSQYLLRVIAQERS